MSNRSWSVLLLLLVLVAAVIVVRDLRKPQTGKPGSIRDTYKMPIAEKPPVSPEVLR